LEAQLETEHEERTLLLREKHELERKLSELQQDEMACKADQLKIQTLKRELKKTRALLNDAHSALERAQKESNPSKVIIKQLKNQLEDSEFAKMAAVKARQCAEAEVRDMQGQMDEISRTKSEIEQRLINVQREKNSVLSHLEDQEDSLKEVRHQLAFHSYGILIFRIYA
jgi:myosin-18